MDTFGVVSRGMTVMQINLKQYFRFYFLTLSTQGQNYLTMHTQSSLKNVYQNAQWGPIR
jgi:hypothetical protein